MNRVKPASDTLKLRQQLTTLNKALKTNNEALEEAQALTHLGSWQWIVSTNEIVWSDELYRIYGLKPQELKIGFTEFLGLIHKDDQARVNGIITGAFQSGEPFEFEHRIVLPNQKIRILYGKGKSVKDKYGNILRMVGTSQDITERKKADQALQLSNERFNAITAATRDTAYDIDLQSGSMWFNEVLTTEYGFTKSKIGNTYAWWLSRIHPDDCSTIESAHKELLEGKSNTWTRDYRVKVSDGDYINVHDRAIILRDDNHKPLRMIGSILDTTHQKQLDQAKDEFISLVSHQLRTPLSVIRTYGEMLNMGLFGELKPEQAEQVGKMTDASVRLIQLVSNILDVSKIESNRINIKPVPSDVNDLIKHHIDDILPLASEKGISIVFAPDTLKKKISLDPMIFGQILQNFLTNSVRYAASTNGRVEIRFAANANDYTLSVSDNGIGIPKSAQPLVFERFYRAKNAANIAEHGTGLGLYLVKMLAEASGGRVWFKCTKNQLTTFHFQMPKTGMFSTSA